LTDEKNYSVYVLTFLPNGKQYVGSTVNVEKRFQQHIEKLKGRRHNSLLLQRDYDLNHATPEMVSISVVKDGMERREARSFEHETMLNLKTFDDRYGYNGRDPAMRSARIENGLAVRKLKHKKRYRKKQQEENTICISLSKFRNLDAEQLKRKLSDKDMDKLVMSTHGHSFWFAKAYGDFDVWEVKKLCKIFDCSFEYLFEVFKEEA